VIARLVVCLMLSGLACAALESVVRAGDGRLRSVTYSNDEIYRLRGYAGYQIDLEFDAGESFIGLGSGDVEGLAFVAQDNHLFIKPKAINVRTNLTVLTTRHAYHFDYVFVRNDDGSESLINFTIDLDELVIHRVARQFIVRRGKLAGCIVNRGYSGSGGALDSGTLSPMVERATRTPQGAQ
jgi:type IV secretory pathway VirB9-like protein